MLFNILSLIIGIFIGHISYQGIIANMINKKGYVYSNGYKYYTTKGEKLTNENK